MMQHRSSPRHWLRFIQGFLGAPRSVGSVAPSSPWLVRAMLDDARVDQAQVIVEYGPGTGVFTDEIIRRMRPDARLLVFEINPRFFALLRERLHDSRVHLIQASAADVADHLQRLGLAAPQCIVSGLPFTSLPRPVTRDILQATRAILQPDGVFVTYQYTLVLRDLFRSYFDTRITRLVLRNLPPAFVFVCRKPA